MAEELPDNAGFTAKRNYSRTLVYSGSKTSNKAKMMNEHFPENWEELWRRRCERDFKREAPQEDESWREMYLRLHEERNERLRTVTETIMLAQANRPKGLEVKIIFLPSVSKPAVGARRLQRKLGCTSISSAASIIAATPIKAKAAPSASPAEHSRPSKSKFVPARSSSDSFTPKAATQRLAALDKPKSQKKAPLMLKAIKALKIKLSRQ